MKCFLYTFDRISTIIDWSSLNVLLTHANARAFIYEVVDEE